MTTRRPRGHPAIRSVVIGLAISGVWRPAAAASPPPHPLADAAIEQLMQGIDGMRRLPVQGMQMVQSGERVFFVSANGRYAFLGPAIDLWHGERLTTLADADRLMSRLDLTRWRLNVSELGALDLGEGARDILVFVDPACPECDRLIERVQALDPAARAPYRFRLIPLAVRGAASRDRVVRLNCLAETDRPAAMQALLTQRVAALPAAAGVCGQGALQRALVTAQVLGINQVPFLIAADGRLQAGAPADLLAWLHGADR